MSHLSALVGLELTRAAKSPVILLSSLATPLFWLFLFGSTFEGTLRPQFQGYDYTTYMTPGLVVLMATFFALASGVRTMADKLGGFLKELLVSPVGRAEIIIGRTLGTLMVVVLQALVLLGIPAALGRGVPMPYGVLSLLGLLASLGFITLGFVGLGMMMATRGKNPQGYQAVIGLLNLPMFFLSGALFPLPSLPGWAKPFIAINPMTYAVELARQSALGTETGYLPPLLCMVGLVGFALVTLSVGARSLRDY